MTFSFLTRVRQWLSRPPMAWPRYLDRASEWWWTQPSRIRLLLPALAVMMVAVGLSFATTKEATTAVVVATRDIEPGTLIGRNDVTTERRPRRFVPDAPAQDADGVAFRFIAKGSVLTRHHLGDGGVSVRLPAGHVAVAVPVGVLPPVSLGDTLTFVEVTYDGATYAFDHTATMVHADGDVLWFAVHLDDAAPIAAAAQTGRISVILHGRKPAP
ncbi:MAG: SAF domain-containing protein [Nitriliruptoraceae bacterium]